MKNLKNLILITAIIIYEEFLFSYLIFCNITNAFYKVIFGLTFSIFIYLIISINKSERFGKILRNIIIALITFVFSAQFVYYNIYESIISFYSFSNGAQVLQFWKTILDVIKNNWNKILLILYPNIITWGLHKTKLLEVKKITKKQLLIGIFVILILHFFAVCCINSSPDDDIYSVKNLYNKSNVPTISVQKLGMVTTMRLDLQRLLTNYKDSSLFAVSNNFKEIETNDIPEYNMLEINWNEIIENESNETLKTMHEYFSTQEPTKKNNYTGMFEGKNVVVFVAEAFDEVAIDEKLTPTLYKMYSQGFQFSNFYTPLFPVSTADGEYITDTSLIPKENVWSISKVANNYMPYSYANVFEGLGYTSHSYHNHSATYYDRDSYLKGMGYDSYLARGTGLENRMDCSNWPNSDLDMINATVDDYINDEKFLAYYMTVSGHLEYNTNGNYIANKNWNLVKDLPYSDKAKCYMACQIELDRAVEALMKRLEEARKTR